MNDIFATLTKVTLYNYADDNTLSAVQKNKEEVISCLTDESKTAVKWFKYNMLEANPTKFQAMVLNDSKDRTCFNIEGVDIITEENVKLLGVYIDDKLNFHHHTSVLSKKAGGQLKVLQRLSKYLNQTSRFNIFQCFILSHFSYCSLVWHFCGAENTRKLECIQYRALKFVFNDFKSSYESLLEKAGLPTLELARKRAILIEVFKSVNKLSPPFLWDLFTPKLANYNLRDRNKLCVKLSRTKRYGLDSLSQYGAKLWNSLPVKMKNCQDLKTFKDLTKNWSENPCRCSLCKAQI